MLAILRKLPRDVQLSVVVLTGRFKMRTGQPMAQLPPDHPGYTVIADLLERSEILINNGTIGVQLRVRNYPKVNMFGTYAAFYRVFDRLIVKRYSSLDEHYMVDAYNDPYLTASGTPFTNLAGDRYAYWVKDKLK